MLRSCAWLGPVSSQFCGFLFFCFSRISVTVQKRSWKIHVGVGCLRREEAGRGGRARGWEAGPRETRGAQEWAERVWVTRTRAEACGQLGRRTPRPCGACVTRGVAGSRIAQKRRNSLCGWLSGQWSPHMGKFTKVKTLNSVMMEKHRNTPYRKRHPQPSFLSSCHLFRWTPNTVTKTEARSRPTE